MKIVARGITLIASSGDSGASGRSSYCSKDRPVNPVFPTSSPWVTSVGGTFIIANNKTINHTSPLCKNNKCATGNKEYVANTQYIGWTAGGGFGYEKRPQWQDKVVNKYFESNIPLPNNFSKGGRAYPDISVVSHNCPTWINGLLMGVDGTSCSSPIFAGIVSILNDNQVKRGKSKLGFISPLLYKMYDSDPSIFTDYTEGNNWCTENGCCPVREDGGSNYGYLATYGYDPVYGLGTPNVGKMIEWLNKYTF
jgi:tripeptidyl-peptidase-1